MIWDPGLYFKHNHQQSKFMGHSFNFSLTIERTFDILTLCTIFQRQYVDQNKTAPIFPKPEDISNPVGLLLDVIKVRDGKS